MILSRRFLARRVCVNVELSATPSTWPVVLKRYETVDMNHHLSVPRMSRGKGGRKATDKRLTSCGDWDLFPRHTGEESEECRGEYASESKALSDDDDNNNNNNKQKNETRKIGTRE